MGENDFEVFHIAIFSSGARILGGSSQTATSWEMATIPRCCATSVGDCSRGLAAVDMIAIQSSWKKKTGSNCHVWRTAVCTAVLVLLFRRRGSIATDGQHALRKKAKKAGWVDCDSEQTPKVCDGRTAPLCMTLRHRPKTPDHAFQQRHSRE